MPATLSTPHPVVTLSDYLRADGVSQSYGDRRVLTDFSLTVHPGQRLGLIGENGAGKSTLLRILAREEVPDVGGVTGPRRLGLLWQEVRYRPHDTLEMLVEGALAEVRAIEAELEAAASALSAGVPHADDRYQAALSAAERADVWTVDARRDEVLDGLGVGALPLDRRLDEVSGGQRSRFALAALLLGRPGALLLDEPTNHLDDSAAAFLTAQLRAWNGPVIFASHDRQFLDEVATGLLDIDPSRSGAQRFGGGYSDYLGEKAAERLRWEAQFAAEQEELRRLRAAVSVTARQLGHTDRAPRDNDRYLPHFKASAVDAAVSRRVHNAEVRLERLEVDQVRKPSRLLAFGGIPHGAQTSDGTLLQLTDVSVPGRLAPTTLRLDSDTRMLVTGQNGAGKSTLLGVAAGTLDSATGSVTQRRGLRVALLEQDVRFADPAVTSRALYASVVGEKRAEVLPLSGLGLIAPRDLDRALGSLSIGQQRRLALALIIARPPHLFLLDEPTNHLSLSLATELEDALGSYPGAVVVASHDRWLRRRWSGEVLALG